MEETTHKFLVHLILLLGTCHRLKPRQGGPQRFGKSLSGKELVKEVFDGHRPNKVASHLVVHILTQLFDGRFLDGREFPCAVAGVFGGRAEE